MKIVSIRSTYVLKYSSVYEGVLKKKGIMAKKNLLIHLCKYSIEFSSADFFASFTKCAQFSLSLSRHCLLVTSGRWKVSKKEKNVLTSKQDFGVFVTTLI